MTQTATKHSATGKAKDILAYTVMPGIIPQIKELGRGGFGYLAYLMAVVYYSVRILPANHPYLLSDNLGKFGIRDVIAAAANNIKITKKNIDQILIFFAILCAVVILVLQIASFLFLFLTGDAYAQAATGGSGAIFKLPDGNAETDIAYHMMREVFGIPDMFGPLPGGRTALHQALHMMLQFYNFAILLVAVLIFIYYVIVVVGETAQTGVPFGKRFSHIYAPIRLVVAVGLLVPLNYGLNGSQYITLFAAKIGSNFASNAWINFNKVVDNPTGQENATLIAETKAPDTVGLVNYMAVAVACREAHRATKKFGGKKEIQMFQKEKNNDGASGQAQLAQNGQLANAAGKYDIEIIFGTQELGFATPNCGSLIVPLTVPLNGSAESGFPGKIQKEYLKLVDGLWNDPKLKQWGAEFANALAGNNCSQGGVCAKASYYPPSDEKEKLVEDTQKSITALVQQHYQDARNTDFKMREETKKLGWGGAGIWYNRIAQVNGAYVVSTFNVPIQNKWPEVMEWVKDAKTRSDASMTGCGVFEPNMADNKAIPLNSVTDKTIAKILYDVHNYWNCHNAKNAANFFIDSISAVFGLQGLMSIRDKVKGEGDKEVDVHPLAKLSALGRGLVENAVRSLGIAVAASGIGGALSILSPHLGDSAEAASAMLVSIATIGLSIGFLTYYILPFMPFMYFFFALGSWVKSIFEAMVGAPLWALAHLRIDGDGLSGKMASNGYFLIFEIFLRPILTVLGLLGGMAIFTALANVLNDIFDVVVLNTANVNLKEPDDAIFSRSIIDVFFFTCLYAVILYMMAVSSFKMINLVPNGILRWIGTSASAFSDNAGDPVEGLTQYAAIGGAKVGGELAGAATQASGAIGKFGAGAMKTAGLGAKTQP